MAGTFELAKFTARLQLCAMIYKLLCLFMIVCVADATALVHGAQPQTSGTSVVSTTGHSLFAMDPSIRQMRGTIDEKIMAIKNLGYAGLSTNNAALENLTTVMAAARAKDLKVQALYLGCEVTTDSLRFPEHFDEVCKVLGQHQSLLWIYFPGKAYKPSDPAADGVVIPALQLAAERAANHGVQIAIYHHRDNWVESFADAIRVAQKVNRSNLGVSFNLCHSLAAGEEEQISDLLRQAGDRLYMVTLNGADSGVQFNGWKRLIQPIGQGTYTLSPLLQQLKEQGYTRPIGFQSFGISGDAVEILEESIKAWPQQ